ncbi:hypothetical protein DYB28_005671 [Aphanomyces astaci]|uniref:CLASP N-terminal domain-containing protein n=1 Tax=Aphanomyces astaci TaxID=112090 RepID=A0A9X8E8Q4_APHAT|nr:hypothetical protein DYB28_005671 [Aphanomyces astaci]
MSVEAANMDSVRDQVGCCRFLQQCLTYVQARGCLHALETMGDWKLQVQELLDLQEVLDELHRNDQLNDDNIDLVLEYVLPLAPFIDGLLPSIRSEVVKTTCRVIGRFATLCGPKFEPFSNQVLVSLLHTARIKTKVFSRAGEDCLAVLSTRSRYSVVELCHLFDTLRAESRCLLVKQVPLILTSWPKPELDPHFGRLKTLLHNALHDKNHLVRAAARDAFCVFADTWSASNIDVSQEVNRADPLSICTRDEHMETLVDVPSPRHRSSFIHEHATARLTSHLVHKFGSPVPAVRTPLRTPTTTRMTPTSIETPPGRRLHLDVSTAESTSSFSSMSSSSDDDMGDDGRHHDLLHRSNQPIHDADESTPPSSSLVAPLLTHDQDEIPLSNSTYSVLRSVVGTVVSWLTFASVLFALYTVTGAVLSALALQQRGGLLVELEQLDMTVARTFHDHQAKEGAMEAAMADLMASVAAQRLDAQRAMATLRESSAAWNKSMRDDMDAFKAEFLSMLVVDMS